MVIPDRPQREVESQDIRISFRRSSAERLWAGAALARVSFFEVGLDQVTPVERNERGPRAVDRDV
jgi:hypothetical protein